MENNETVSQEKTFITHFEKENGRYAGPPIKARSWEEAEAEAKKILKVVGVLSPPTSS